MALSECQNHFNDHRWNCTGLNEEQVFQEMGIMKTGKCQLYLFVAQHIVD